MGSLGFCVQAVEDVELELEDISNLEGLKDFCGLKNHFNNQPYIKVDRVR